MNNDEIIAIFFGECIESLEAAEDGLSALREGSANDDTVNAVFRAVHSVKGGAGAFGYSALQAFAHGFESLLSDVRDGSIAIGNDLVDLLLRALDVLSDHVTAARGDGPAPDDLAVLAELEAARVSSEGAGPPAGDAPAAVVVEIDGGDDEGFDVDLDSLLDSLAPIAAGEDHESNAEGWIIKLRPGAGALRNGGEPLLLLRDLVALGAECIGCDVDGLPPVDLVVPGENYLGWTFRVPASVSEAEVREVFEFVGDDCPIAIGKDAPMPPVTLSASPARRPSTGPEVKLPVDPDSAVRADPMPDEAAPQAPTAITPGQSIRIDLAKLDRLIDAVGELVIAQAVVAQHFEESDASANEHLAMLETLTRDIQESAMAIRAQPIGTVFSRVPRILRELATSTGKHVRLEVSGETTELDKTVIERLGEPLTHLIRNAVDHGIEDAQARLAAGKSADGTLTLSAEHRSGRIAIRIADDGRGIDRQRVLAKAVEHGIVAPEAILSNDEIDNLIFAPGFSTAQQLSNISGRGVGMDVVRQAVKELGGRITIESHPGAGTTFLLTLPLTLAISDGMVVRAGDQTLIVPLANVLESLRPRPGEVRAMGSGHYLIEIRGQFVPVIAVRSLLGGASPDTAPEHGVLVVVDTEASGPAALWVDDIRDQRQFVIKSLDTHYRAVEGIAGATILGDGRVALIVDVDGVVAIAGGRRMHLRDAA